jgi:CBS domain-containing protein
MPSNDTPDVTRLTGDDMSISPSTSVREALSAMERSGLRTMVVVDGGRPVGVITATALHGSADRTMSIDAEVQDVMDFEVVHVDPSFDVEDTLRTFRDAAWHSVRRRRPFAERADSR